MKKALIILCSVLCLNSPNAEAQESNGNSFILATITNHINNQNQGRLHIFLTNQNGSYLYVRSNSSKTAMRYGIGIGERYNNVSTNSYVRNDTSFVKSTYTSSAVPRLIIGKELQKTIHPDVMFVLGVDASVGGGAARSNVLVDAEYEASNFSDLSSVQKGFTLYGGLTPFTGMRVSWGRIALGYTFSLPMELDAVFQGSSSSQSFDMGFAHNISAGYRIFNTKK